MSVLADDILKNVEFDALRIVYNKFHSVVAFLPTVSTVLSPEVSHNCWTSQFVLNISHSALSINLIVYVCVLHWKIIEKESEIGGKLGELDSYEIEGGETKGEILQNLAEFQFSCVSNQESLTWFMVFQHRKKHNILVVYVNSTRWCSMRFWRMHVVRWEQECLPWTAQAETQEKCSTVSPSHTTGLVKLLLQQSLLRLSLELLLLKLLNKPIRVSSLFFALIFTPTLKEKSVLKFYWISFLCWLLVETYQCLLNDF